MIRLAPIALSLGLAALLVTPPLLAQSPPTPSASEPSTGQHRHGGDQPGHQPMSGHQHMPGHQPMHGHHAAPAAEGPTPAGQDAFAAIAEIVRLLEADGDTDWSRVDLEQLRRHLVDMNEVVLRADVRARPVPGGLVMDVTGAPRTERAIRAMVAPHAVELDRMAEWTAQTVFIPGGLRLTVIARATDDGKTVARIRGLGFIGLLVQGGHHGPHHLAMAKGEMAAGSHRH